MPSYTPANYNARRMGCKGQYSNWNWLCVRAVGTANPPPRSTTPCPGAPGRPTLWRRIQRGERNAAVGESDAEDGRLLAPSGGAGPKRNSLASLGNYCADPSRSAKTLFCRACRRIIAEFASPVETVRCAVAIQQVGGQKRGTATLHRQPSVALRVANCNPEIYVTIECAGLPLMAKS